MQLLPAAPHIKNLIRKSMMLCPSILPSTVARLHMNQPFMHEATTQMDFGGQSHQPFSHEATTQMDFGGQSHHTNRENK